MAVNMIAGKGAPRQKRNRAMAMIIEARKAMCRIALVICFLPVDNPNVLRSGLNVNDRFNGHRSRIVTSLCVDGLRKGVGNRYARM
jgi:hypothetical protein